MLRNTGSVWIGLLLGLAGCAALATSAGCSRGEDGGVEEAAEDTGEAAEEAAEDMGEAAEDAADEAGEAADNLDEGGGSGGS